MQFSHLGLPVRGLRRSQQFYSAYFGFDRATAREYEDGTVIIRNADGFDLALHPVGQVEPSPAFLHAGFRAAEPAHVRALMNAWRPMASPSWSGTMKQPTWPSNALTRTATGSRCTGSRCVSSDAESAGRSVRMRRTVRAEVPTPDTRPSRGSASWRHLFAHVGRATSAVVARYACECDQMRLIKRSRELNKRSL
jgi:catechol 2,3-dioxygenase-like lactoylglutathione lyase family enzyme